MAGKSSLATPTALFVTPVADTVDGEAQRVLWFIGESSVSIANRRLRNPSFDHVQR
ncbi:hypothetical protein SO802_004742 [Lithocarpus litseifolius]|uniref:Uncharacterized protein n=1 Tax=Lithocarpus litseifolius TaxID=425828 RepID=A0AAW2E3V9_9ROSI